MIRLYDYKRILSSIIFHFLCLILAFILLYPVLWMLLASFKENKEIFSGSILKLPKKWLFSNYINGWNGINNFNFSLYFKNSIMLSGISTFLIVLTSALSGYGFSNNNFFLKKFWFFMLILTMIFPSQILIIPQYIIFRYLKITGTFLPIILSAGLTNSFYVFFVVQFMRTIPKEIEETAKIDGAGKFMIFFKIYLPLSKSILFTIAVLSFNFIWNDYLLGLIYLTKNNLWTVAIALTSYSTPSIVRNFGVLFAMAVLSIIPSFIVFIFMHFHIVEGIKITGFKA